MLIKSQTYNNKKQYFVDDTPWYSVQGTQKDMLIASLIQFMYLKDDIAERFQHTPIDQLKPQEMIKYLLPKYGTTKQEGLVTVTLLNI